MTDRSASAGLAVLIALQLVMLAALYAGVPPHPPATLPLFAAAPFLGTAVAAAIAALVMGPGQGAAGRGLALLAAALALLSFGPQKFLDAQFAAIWPAVLCGQAAAATVIWRAVRGARADVAR